MEWSAIIRLQCKDAKGGKTLTGSRNAYCEFLKSRNELQAWADTRKCETRFTFYTLTG